MAKKTKEASTDNKNVKSLLNSLNIFAFVCTLLAVLVCAGQLIPDDTYFLLFCVTTPISAVPVLINLRLPKKLRIKPFEFVCRKYWHPNCTLLISIGLMLSSQPFDGNILLKSINIVGIVTIACVILWEELYYYICKK